MKLSDSSELQGLKTTGNSGLPTSTSDNSLGLKLSSSDQLNSIANNSSGFDGGSGSHLNGASDSISDLHPQGTSFFGTGGGASSSSGDPNVVDLRDAKTLSVDPARVNGTATIQPDPNQMKSVGGVGASLQGTPDKLPAPNLTASHQSADNQLGLKLSDSDEGGLTSSPKPANNSALKGSLPGIYLNDTTGKGNNTPYGISGLPGIYVNGASEGVGLSQPNHSPKSNATSQPNQPVTTPSQTEAISQPASQPATPPTETVTAKPTINLGNAGKPDFDGNAGGNAPITSQKTGGQADIAAQGENVKDPVATSPSGQKGINIGGVPIAETGLTSVQPVAGSGKSATSAGDQLLSAAASGQNSGQNFDTGGSYVGSLNMPSRGGVDSSTVVDLKGKQGVVDPASTLQGKSPAVSIAYATPNIRGLDSPNPAVNAPLTPEQLQSKAVVAQGIINVMNAAADSYTDSNQSGFVVIKRFSLVDKFLYSSVYGNDAVLYGACFNGKTNQLILAFRGTTQDAKPLQLFREIDNSIFNHTESSADTQMNVLGLAFLISQKLWGIEDWTGANSPNQFGSGSERFERCIAIAKQVQREYPGIPIMLTGHSLGGGEAALAAVATGIPAITFNAEGVDLAKYGYLSADTSRITNYYVVGEPLTALQSLSITTLGIVPKFLHLPAYYTPAGAIGKQIAIYPATLPTLSNALNHGMSSVEPAMLYYLSK